MPAAENSSRIGILYEHPQWFTPLFAALDRHGVAYHRMLATEHWHDPQALESPYPLIFNRLSASAYLRGNGHVLFWGLQYLAYLRDIGTNVVNPYEAYVIEISKAQQLSLFRSLGLRAPRTRVIHHPGQAAAAADGFTFPILVKPNIGGRGAMIVRFDRPEELAAAASNGGLDLGIDQTALVQEYLPAAGGHIVRVEVLGGEFLYAIKVYPKPEEGFNLCPAEMCRVDDPPRLGMGICPADAPAAGLQVEGYTLPREQIEDVLRIAKAARIDVGGVEYLVSARDGQVYYYDINALSNFVADAPRVVGFDPYPRLIAYLRGRLQG